MDDGRPVRGMLFLGAFLWNMCNGMLFVLTPLFGVSLGLSVLDIGSLVGLPYLMTIVMRFVGGAFADRYGEHRMLQVCYSLNVLAAAGLYMAGGFFSLMLSSALANLSRSMFWVPAQSMASQLSSRDPGKMLGQLSAANYTGQLLGLALGGILAGWLGYGTTFILVALASVVGMLLGFALPPIRLKPGGRTVWQITVRMSRRLVERRTWLLISSSCAAAVPLGITQSIYPVYMSDLSFSAGWISVVIAVRSLGPVVIGLALGSDITIEREKLFYALSMGGTRSLHPRQRVDRRMAAVGSLHHRSWHGGRNRGPAQSGPGRGSQSSQRPLRGHGEHRTRVEHGAHGPSVAPGLGRRCLGVRGHVPRHRVFLSAHCHGDSPGISGSALEVSAGVFSTPDGEPLSRSKNPRQPVLTGAPQVNIRYCGNDG